MGKVWKWDRAKLFKDFLIPKLKTLRLKIMIYTIKLTSFLSYSHISITFPSVKYKK